MLTFQKMLTFPKKKLGPSRLPIKAFETNFFLSLSFQKIILFSEFEPLMEKLLLFIKQSFPACNFIIFHNTTHTTFINDVFKRLNLSVEFAFWKKLIASSGKYNINFSFGEYKFIY